MWKKNLKEPKQEEKKKKRKKKKKKRTTHMAPVSARSSGSKKSSARGAASPGPDDTLQNALPDDRAPLTPLPPWTDPVDAATLVPDTTLHARLAPLLVAGSSKRGAASHRGGNGGTGDGGVNHGDRDGGAGTGDDGDGARGPGTSAPTVPALRSAVAWLPASAVLTTSFLVAGDRDRVLDGGGVDSATRLGEAEALAAAGSQRSASRGTARGKGDTARSGGSGKGTAGGRLGSTAAPALAASTVVVRDRAPNLDIVPAGPAGMLSDVERVRLARRDLGDGLATAATPP
jgi:hypothetical protein